MSELSEILQEAIKLEHDGERYYEMAAKKAQNPLAKNTFRALAEQERDHASLLGAHLDALSQTGVPPTAQSINAKAYSLLTTAKEIFDKARAELEGGQLASENLDELYETAIDMERKSIALYQAEADKADADQHRDFFEYLVAQERDHLQLLSNGQHFLADPASWYMQEEQWSFEG